jgi:hypothetical protein
MQENWLMQNGQRSSPLVNEIRPKPMIMVDRPFSCKEISMPPTPTSPGMLSPGLSSGQPSPGMPSPTYTVFSESNVVMVPPAPPTTSLWKFLTVMLSGHMAAALIPSTLIRIFVLGIVTDVCLLAFVSPLYPSSVGYLSSFFGVRN